MMSRWSESMSSFILVATPPNVPKTRIASQVGADADARRRHGRRPHSERLVGLALTGRWPMVGDPPSKWRGERDSLLCSMSQPLVPAAETDAHCRTSTVSRLRRHGSRSRAVK